VAEAHPAQQQQLSAALGGLAVEAVVVAEGQEVVDAWRQERWDMLLIDIDDPTLGGRALIRSIRGAEASARWRPTPILALADARGPDDIDEAFAEMIDGVVVKPVSVAALAEALQAALDVVPAATAPVTFARAAFA
jgi:CheY-like chemotaxis protein